jgi:hypothetical protein
MAKRRDIIRRSKLLGRFAVSFCPEISHPGTNIQKLLKQLFKENRRKYRFLRLFCPEIPKSDKKIKFFLKKLLTLQLPHTSRYEHGGMPLFWSERQSRGIGTVLRV